MRERIESKHVTKEIKSQMPVIPVEIVKERGCTFCPYYLGNYEKQPRCMMKICAWDDENERFHLLFVKRNQFTKNWMETLIFIIPGTDFHHTAWLYVLPVLSGKL